MKGLSRFQRAIVDEPSVAKAGIRHICFTFSWQAVSDGFGRVSGAIIMFNKARDLVAVVDAKNNGHDVVSGSVKHYETHSHTDAAAQTTTVHEACVIDSCHLPPSICYIFFVICSSDGAQLISSPSLECYDIRRKHLGPMAKINVLTPASIKPQQEVLPPVPPQSKALAKEDDQSSVASFVVEHRFVPSVVKPPAPAQSVNMALLSRVGDGFKLEPVCVKCPGHIDRMGELKRTLVDILRHRTHTKKEAQQAAAKAKKPPPTQKQVQMAMEWQPRTKQSSARADSDKKNRKLPKDPESLPLKTDGINIQSIEELTMSPELASMLRRIRESIDLSKVLDGNTTLDNAAMELGIVAECSELKTFRSKASRIMKELAAKGILVP